MLVDRGLGNLRQRRGVYGHALAPAGICGPACGHGTLVVTTAQRANPCLLLLFSHKLVSIYGAEAIIAN